jgi:hypothetical protein
MEVNYLSESTKIEKQFLNDGDWNWMSIWEFFGEHS